MFSGEVSENNIKEVEKILNVKFPVSYKWFLRKYGQGGIEGIDIQGIEEDKESMKDTSVVYLTQQYRARWKINPQWVVIEDIGEEIIVLDTNVHEDECPVISWSQHDGEIIIKNNNFAEYLLEKIKYMLE